MSPGRRAMGDSAGRGVTCEPGTCSHGDTRDVLGGTGYPARGRGARGSPERKATGEPGAGAHVGARDGDHGGAR